MGKCCDCGLSIQQYPVISARGTSYRPYCPDCDIDKIAEMEKRNEDAIVHILTKADFPKVYVENRDKLSKYLRKSQIAEIDKGKGALLTGDSGLGKTKALVALAEYMITKGKSVKFVDFSDFICELRADFKLYNGLKTEILSSADCLFFDNFETDNKYMYDFIFNLVNSLYNAGKQVFYANYTLPTAEGLAMRIGYSTIQIQLVKKV